MSDGGNTQYVPDRLYARLFQPWTLPEAEWPLCKEDWARVDAITALPWNGKLLDFGAGDGTLAAMVCSRNPLVKRVHCVERDSSQFIKYYDHFGAPKDHEYWKSWKMVWPMEGVRAIPTPLDPYDGALCCEVLEHLTAEEGHKVLCDIKKVLKPNAMLCVTVPHENGSRAAFPGHIRQFGLTSILESVRGAGFSVFEEAWSDSGFIYPGAPWLWAVCRA